MVRFLPLLLAACTISARAQELSGLQRDTLLGFAFTIPEGWVGARAEGGYVFGHSTIAGAILLSASHHSDLEALARTFSEPTNDDASFLKAQTPPHVGPDSTVRVVQTGTWDGTPAKVIAVAKLNPYGGNTANFLALAPEDVFGAELEAALLAMEQSIHYLRMAPVAHIAVEEGTIDDIWSERLSGTRLTYLESYSSPAPVEGSIGGGYSIDRRIDLCPEGYYTTGSHSEHTFSGSEVSAAGSERTKGAGRWSAVQPADGNAVLRLAAHDGNVREYRLGYEDGKTYLNGERWYRTSLAADGPEYAPDCP